MHFTTDIEKKNDSKIILAVMFGLKMMRISKTRQFVGNIGNFFVFC